MTVGELKELLKDANDDVEVVFKYSVNARTHIKLASVLSVVDDDGSIPGALIASGTCDESQHAVDQRNHFGLWEIRSEGV